MKDTVQTVEAGRQFSSDVQALYNAWIQADQLKQWWQPANNKLVHVENEVTEGGNIRYGFETSGGEKSFTITGQYKEVKPAAKLVYTWNWEMPGGGKATQNHFELTVTFSGEGNESHIHITQKDLDAQESIHPHHKGWEEELERLAQFLQSSAVQ